MLTLQLASPLKRLIEAVERFGAGDLSARANVVRRDEIGSLASAFDQMANRIETLLVAERRLLQDLSHELRSPLSRLLLALRLADQGDLETARVRMHKEVRRIVDLVESLTQVTRAETDLGTSRLERVAMDVLVRELVEDCHFEARDRECRILVGGQSHATLLADRELLRRAIENVFRNADHHAPPGTTIDVALNRSGAEVTVSVRDYGPGVPPKDLANIFKPFFRADESRTAATGGVGLGLAIAKRALRVHNGQIWAENADPGLRVYITLPVEHAVELAAVNT